MSADTGRAGAIEGAATEVFRPSRGRRFRVVAPYVLLIVCWLGAFPFLRHRANADGISYAVVAELWLSGQWATAVNAYWAPLLSWLMTPLMLADVPAVEALQLVQLGGALACLPSLRSLSRRAGASAAATDVMLLASAPFLVYNVLHTPSPEILLAAALLRCCDLLFRPEFCTSAYTATAAGVWGGVAYLAKAYAAPVVLVLLPVGVLVHLVSARGASRGPLLRRGGLAVAGFAVVFVGWAGLLSISYGELTFSTSAGHNTRLIAPGSAGNPLDKPGLYPPAREGALSAWEEPSQLPIRARDDAPSDGPSLPGGETDAGTERIETAFTNMRIVAATVVKYGSPSALLALVGLAWFALRRRPPSPALTGTLLAGAISAGGLVLSLAIDRYVWFSIITCVPAAAVGLDVLMRRRRRALPIVGAALVTVMAATSLYGLLPQWNADRDVIVAIEQLNRQGGLDGAVATTGHSSWPSTVRLCHDVGCQYFGRPESRDAAGAAEELSAAGVDYLVVWHDEQEEVVAGLPGPDGPGILALYAVTPHGLVLDHHVGRDDAE